MTGLWRWGAEELAEALRDHRGARRPPDAYRSADLSHAMTDRKGRR